MILDERVWWKEVEEGEEGKGGGEMW